MQKTSLQCHVGSASLWTIKSQFIAGEDEGGVDFCTITLYLLTGHSVTSSLGQAVPGNWED